MTNRTIQILGQAFGATPATVIATLDGNTVFSGTVPTINEPVWQLPNADDIPLTVPLFEFEIPMDFVGNIPMTCEVVDQTVIFAQIKVNYTAVTITPPDPDTNQGANIVTSGETGFLQIGNPDPRYDVLINGEPIVVDRGPLTGTWWWTVESPGIMSYSLNIASAGKPN
jgi:hypothetical protein